MTELTGSNLCHARPGAGRALVGNGKTGRVQSQRIPPVTGIAYRQEDRRVRLLNRVDSATACGQLHTLPGNEDSIFFFFIGIYGCFVGLSLVFVGLNYSSCSPRAKRKSFVFSGSVFACMVKNALN